MKILFTGKDDFKYNRTRILLTGLHAHPAVEVVEYPLNKEGYQEREFQKHAQWADFLYLGAFRHSDVKIVKKKTSTPLVFDPLISKYLTRTIDYGKWWSAPEKYLRDRVAFKNSDIIMMDTQGDIDWVVEKYKLDPEQLFVLPIGVDTSIFKPVNTESRGGLTVGFHGGFIPLQGMDKIIETARLLAAESDINFDIVGAGPEYKKITRMAEKYGLSNVKFRGWVNYIEINPIINAFDVCLGIFGNSIKTDLVIPNKVYEYAALKKCIITKDTIGIREIFTPDKDVKLTPADPEKMAQAVVEMRDDPTKRNTMGTEAFELIAGGYNERKIGEIFVKNLQEWLSRQGLI